MPKPTKFQFHKGTIRTQIPVHNIRAAFAHFNSIKVRLEHVANDTLVRGILFQFHKGTIRTRYF